MAVWCDFCYQSVFFFTNGVYRKLFSMFFITTICVYDFCETVLVKKKHTLPRYDLNFPFQHAAFLHWLFDGTAQTHLWALKRQKKKRRGRCPQAPAGACAPRTLRPSVLKKRPPCQLFFCCTYFPVEMKNVGFWVKLHSFLNLWQCGVFSVTKVCVFCYQWCL